MAVYLHHTQCPNCAEMGKDTARDNLAVYSDGSTYCFGCNTYTKGDSLPTKKEKPVYELVLTNKIPEKLRTHLRQYLSDNEIDDWFQYEPNMDRYIFHYKGEEGTFWEARNPEKKPKSIQNGKKPFFPLINLEDETNTLVIVEDLISAICVGRYFSSLPLFGSFIRPEWIGEITKSKLFNRVFVWLDEDKTQTAIDISRKISILKPSYVIRTKEDPKAIFEEEMREILNEPRLYFDVVGQQES